MTHILIAGGGVAAVEAVAALRALAGPRLDITLLAPEAELTPRAPSVGAPFGLGAPAPLPYEAIRRHAPFDLREGELAGVDVDAHVAIDSAGERLEYDRLLIAVGAVPEPALPGALTFAGPRDAVTVATALADSPRLAFVLPSPTSWSLPVYELAIMAAVELRDRGSDAQLTVVTPEHAPLWVFGPEASAAVRGLLAERGIALRAGARALAVHEGELHVTGGPPVAADHVIALPRMRGPELAGLPSGFLAVDAHGRVEGAPDVYAAGDATAFPLKQGGLAAQQADAAAQAIAASVGVPIVPEPFRPVLRGLLLTGGAPLYLRSTLGPSGQPRATHSRRSATPVGTVSRRALWWPPGKIAGRYVAPLLATARPPVLAQAPLEDLAAPPAVDDALTLALLLAEEEAAAGDVAEALHAVDAAAALAGGTLPREWAARRKQWAAAVY